MKAKLKLFISVLVLIIFLPKIISVKSQKVDFNSQSKTNSASPDNILYNNAPTPSILPSPTITPKPSPTPLPKSHKLQVPFVVQAPFANWDALHEDACEEASLLIAQLYTNQLSEPTPTLADEKIKALVAYGEELKQEKSITLAQLSDLAKYVYNLDSQIFAINSADDIKRIISAGNPVIVGAAGKILKNPHFSNGGPNYHMLVITGYDEKGFITNDPGIKEGRDFRYTESNLMESIHDWNENDIKKGEKVGMFLIK